MFIRKMNADNADFYDLRNLCIRINPKISIVYKQKREKSKPVFYAEHKISLYSPRK